MHVARVPTPSRSNNVRQRTQFRAETRFGTAHERLACVEKQARPIEPRAVLSRRITTIPNIPLSRPVAPSERRAQNRESRGTIPRRESPNVWPPNGQLTGAAIIELGPPSRFLGGVRAGPKGEAVIGEARLGEMYSDGIPTQERNTPTQKGPFANTMDLVDGESCSESEARVSSRCSSERRGSIGR